MSEATAPVRNGKAADPAWPIKAASGRTNTRPCACPLRTKQSPTTQDARSGVTGALYLAGSTTGAGLFRLTGTPMYVLLVALCVRWARPVVEGRTDVRSG